MARLYKIVYVLAILTSIFVLILSSSFKLTQEQNVVSVTDGDTITILQPDKSQLKVRLAEIDCPEKKQPFGTKAKEVLSSKIFGKNVKVEWSKKDRYGRVIGKVYIGNRYINKEMIEEGWAWHYTQYSHSKDMAEAQEYAKTHKLGLWMDKNPVPPWRFRKK